MPGTFIAFSQMAAGWTAVIVAAWGLIFLQKQVAQGVQALQHSAAAAQHSAIATVLQLEQSISHARLRYTDTMSQLGEVLAKVPAADKELTGLHRARVAAALEHYVNSLDRLAACIIRGIVDEDEYREDYRNTFLDAITNHPKEFGPDTRHRNILNVHNAWSEGRRARLTKRA